MKRLTDEERELFAAFSGEYWHCWACGISTVGVLLASTGIDYPRHLETHHLIGGAGRVHDRRNLTRLCKMCHDLTHGATIRLKSGKVIPRLRLDHILWLKSLNDGPLDRKFLRTLRPKILPPSQIPPRFFQKMHATTRRCSYEELR